MVADLGDLSADQGVDQVPSQLNDAYYQDLPLNEEITSGICQWLYLYTQRAMLEINKDDSAATEQRKQLMNKVNPKYLLRNYLAQQAIDKSELGDHSMLEELLEVMRLPYDEQPDKENYALKRPEWARHKAGCSMLSCSS